VTSPGWASFQPTTATVADQSRAKRPSWWCSYRCGR
jgi:hypothetical protein